jgi:hypothetical protein
MMGVERVAMVALVDVFGVSQHLACLVVSWFRSTQCDEPVRSPQEVCSRK